MAPIPPSASRFGALIDTVQSSACSPHGQELLPGAGLALYCHGFDILQRV